MRNIKKLAEEAGENFFNEFAKEGRGKREPLDGDEVDIVVEIFKRKLNKLNGNE